MASREARPKGGILGDDNFYAPCRFCDGNRNGLFTEKNGDGVAWRCARCGARWHRETGEPLYGHPGRGPGAAGRL